MTNSTLLRNTGAGTARLARAWALATIVMSAAALGCSSDEESGAAGTDWGPPSASPNPANPTTPANPGGTPTTPTNPGGTNVSLGGSQDFGYFRGELEAGRIPPPAALDAAGFFAEHHIELPPPACGERVCLQPMLGVMGSLFDGSNCTMLHVGLNSPLAADPGERPPLSLVVVVDVSGSMQGPKIDYVRQGLELLIDGMRDEDQLALVTYADNARLLMEMTPVELQRADLRAAAESLVADGSTNIGAGLDLGYQEALANYDGARQNRVILLSDGQPTVGILDVPTLLELSRAYNSEGIGLTSIGLGSDFNLELMRGLALQADGNFYFLEDTGAVNEVFQEELSFFVVPVAFDLDLRVTSGADYEIGRALGSPFWDDTSQGGELAVPSVFLAHRESDDDVTPDDGRRGGGSSLLLELMPLEDAGDEGDAPVATVDLTFREPGSDRVVEDSVTIRYPDSPRSLRSEGYFEAERIASVHKSFVMLNIFVGLEQAVVDYSSARANETTLARLDNLIAAVGDYNDEVRDTDIELDLDLLELLRVNLVRAGVQAETPEIPADPWPAD